MYLDLLQCIILINFLHESLEKGQVLHGIAYIQGLSLRSH